MKNIIETLVWLVVTIMIGLAIYILSDGEWMLVPIGIVVTIIKQVIGAVKKKTEK